MNEIIVNIEVIINNWKAQSAVYEYFCSIAVTIRAGRFVEFYDLILRKN